MFQIEIHVKWMLVMQIQKQISWFISLPDTNIRGHLVIPKARYSEYTMRLIIPKAKISVRVRVRIQVRIRVSVRLRIKIRNDKPYALFIITNLWNKDMYKFKKTTYLS